MTRFQTLHELLDAARDDREITFIDGQDQQRVLGFARLRARALAVLGELQRRGLRPGATLILAIGDNERFVEAFWAAILGGIVPVPLAPAVTDEQRRKLVRVFAQLGSASVCIDGDALDRLDAFAADADARADAGDGERDRRAGGDRAFAESARRIRRVALSPASLAAVGAPGAVHPASADDLAFVQYSSGSTGTPKGVLLSHRNLTANVAAIAEAAAFSDRDRALSWMPLSHDMGLIGFHLSMLAAGIGHALMRTELFARRPLLWLELASRLRSTLLCSPNFGYEHYLRQYASKPAARLDLAAVRLIFNGAEPVSAPLCRRFVQTLAPHGLKARAMFPVYGLAEASLAVTFPAPGAPLETVVPAAGGVERVVLGRALPGSELRIVDDDGAPVADAAVGHVQIRGENVSRGYWGDDAEVGAHRGGGWLDTGDLGLLADGRLAITGRAKDLVILKGQNHYPHDLERIAEQVPGVEAQRVAAAGVRAAGGESEGLALFVVHRLAPAAFVAKAIALREALAAQAGVEVVDVVPVPTLPKTSSGKLQRYALAAAYERGDYAQALAALAPLVAAATNSAPSVADVTDPPVSTLERLLAACRRVVPELPLAADTHLLESQLNSLTLARIHEAIEREFPQRVEVTDLFDYPTLRQLAAFLDARAR